MEGATLPRALPLRRREEARQHELQELRPLGEAYLLRHFGHTFDRADAEDAVAEVVIRLHRKIEAGEAPRNLRAAFFTSCRNAAIDLLRSRSAKPTVGLEVLAEAPAENVGPVERAEHREDAVRLREVLERMRGNYREAIMLRFGVGLTVPEIAERLQISLPAAKKLVLRATEQARDRLAGIEGEDFCPQVRELAQRVVIDAPGSGLASASEHRALQAHLRHCGSCRTFISALQHNLHELGGAAALAAAAGSRSGFADHLAGWASSLGEGGHALVAKARLAAFRVGTAFGGNDGSGAGALAGPTQKALAICGAATASAATCLATGIVGPGVGAFGAAESHSAGHSQPAKVRLVSEEPPPEVPPVEVPPVESTPPPAPPSQVKPEESAPAPEPAPTPSQQSAEEFGVEGGSAEANSSSAPPEAPPPPASVTATPSAGGGSGGRGGGGEQFGFGG